MKSVQMLKLFKWKNQPQACSSSGPYFLFPWSTYFYCLLYFINEWMQEGMKEVTVDNVKVFNLSLSLCSAWEGCFHNAVWSGGSFKNLVFGLHWLHQLFTSQVWVSVSGGHYTAHLPWPLPLPAHLLPSKHWLFSNYSMPWSVLPLCNLEIY